MFSIREVLVNPLLAIMFRRPSHCNAGVFLFANYHNR